MSTNTETTENTQPGHAEFTEEEKALFEELAERFDDRGESEIFEILAQSSTEESNS